MLASLHEVTKKSLKKKMWKCVEVGTLPVVKLMRKWMWKCVEVDTFLSWSWWKSEGKNVLMLMLYSREVDEKVKVKMC